METNGPVVILTAGVPPWPGWPGDADGARAWGIGQGLAALGFAVSYALTLVNHASLVTAEGRTPPDGVALLPPINAGLAEVLPANAVVVSVGWLPARHDLGRPLVLDLAAPTLAGERPGQHLDGLVEAKLAT